MCKTFTIIWDKAKGQETGLFCCIHFLNRKKLFSPLALANLKGLPKLKTMNPSPTILSGINRALCVPLR
jgi:hypothetical protein